ncbi:MAG: hypothetical protein HY907_19470 [Deltaproteobacteria bacterium]|nr:hypothetical protein [Deltaproteobacteria bacterium]
MRAWSWAGAWCALAAMEFVGACGDGSATSDVEDDAGMEAEADAAPDDTPDARPDAEAEVELEADADVVEDAGREDAEAADWGLPCPDPLATFDPDDPGMHSFFLVAEVFMMGTAIDTAAGGFLPAAREDFNRDDPPGEIPLDSCRLAGSGPAIRECTTAADCAPEQQCNPETDASGNPIPDSGVCETPRETVDVGPFTCTGFATDQTFQYNPAQSGAYTSTADGTLPPGLLELGATYDCAGDGDPATGLGRFRGTIFLPAELELTSPPSAIGPGGFPLVDVDPSVDLVLAWSGGDGASELSVNLTGGTGTVECRLLDDGAHTIAADLVTAAGLGNIPFFNIMELRRERWGLACGEGLTDAEWTSTVTTILNVRKVGE